MPSLSPPTLPMPLPQAEPKPRQGCLLEGSGQPWGTARTDGAGAG